MSFAEALAGLVARHGAEAAGIRHEAYFIRHRRSPLPGTCRAAFAAARDAWLCLRLPRRSMVHASVVAIANRAGPSGLGAIEPCLAELRAAEIDYVLMTHPRLRGLASASLPGRPSIAGWWRALKALAPRPATLDREGFVVACCLFRLRLWREAWSRTLAGGTGLLLLHNDFELFSVAAIEGGARHWRSACVQHGLPTDEFFPTRANFQLLWGDSSRSAYIARGTAPEACLYGPAPAAMRPPHSVRPTAVRLVSQTHTPIYGRSLADDFASVATTLARHFPKAGTFAVLLHPEEGRLGHPYAQLGLAAACRHPPHPEFAPAPQPCMLVGFCSTALLDAARRGHLVVGLDWAVPESRSALAVGSPPLKAAGPDELCALLRRLITDDAERAEAFSRQDDWLQRTFSGRSSWLEDLAT